MQGFFEANIIQTLEFVEGATTTGGSYPTYIIDNISKAIRHAQPTRCNHVSHTMCARLLLDMLLQLCRLTNRPLCFSVCNVCKVAGVDSVGFRLEKSQ